MEEEDEWGTLPSDATAKYLTEDGELQGKLSPWAHGPSLGECCGRKHKGVCAWARNGGGRG